MSFPIQKIGLCRTLSVKDYNTLIEKATAGIEAYLVYNPSRRSRTFIQIEYSHMWRAYVARAKYRCEQGTMSIGHYRVQG